MQFSSGGFECGADSRRDDGQRSVLLPCGAESDLDVLTEGRKEFHEASHGEAAGAVSHQQGNLRLLHAEDPGNLGLGLAAALEDSMDLQGELSLEQLLLRIGEAQVGKDILAALGDAGCAGARPFGFGFHANCALLLGQISTHRSCA